MPISQMPHLDFEGFDGTASLPSLMEDGLSKSDKEPSQGVEEKRPTINAIGSATSLLRPYF